MFKNVIGLLLIFFLISGCAQLLDKDGNNSVQPPLPDKELQDTDALFGVMCNKIFDPKNSADYESFLADGKYGIQNKNGDIIVSPIYDAIYMSGAYSYALKKGAWVCLDLKNGYEKTYEKFDKQKENQYDEIFNMKSYDIVIVNGKLLINGQVESDDSSFPICVLSNFMFNTYVSGQDSMLQPAILTEGDFEGEIDIKFDKRLDFALPYFKEANYNGLVKKEDTSKYLKILNSYKLKNQISNKLIIKNCFEGDIYGNGVKGAIFEISDMYDYWGQELDGDGENSAITDALILVENTSKLEDYKVIWECILKDSDSESEGYINAEKLDNIVIADIDSDNKVEVIATHQIYEITEPIIIKIP